MAFNFTNRAGNEVKLEFAIEDWFAHRVENPKMTWSVPPSDTKPSIASTFGLDYQNQANLRESSEYAVAAEAYAEAHKVDVSLFAIKKPQESRPTAAITKAHKAAIGEQVVIKMESITADDGQADENWVISHLHDLFHHAKLGGFSPKARPAKPAPKAPGGGKTKAQIQEALDAAEAELERLKAQAL